MSIVSFQAYSEHRKHRDDDRQQRLRSIVVEHYREHLREVAAMLDVEPRNVDAQAKLIGEAAARMLSPPLWPQSAALDAAHVARSDAALRQYSREIADQVSWHCFRTFVSVCVHLCLPMPGEPDFGDAPTDEDRESTEPVEAGP